MGKDKKKSVKRPPQAPAKHYGPRPPGMKEPHGSGAQKTPEQLAGKMRKVH